MAKMKVNISGSGNTKTHIRSHRLKTVTVKYNAQVKPFQQLHVEFSADIEGLSEAEIDDRIKDLMDRILHYLDVGKEYINIVTKEEAAQKAWDSAIDNAWDGAIDRKF